MPQARDDGNPAGVGHAAQCRMGLANGDLGRPRRPGRVRDVAGRVIAGVGLGMPTLRVAAQSERAMVQAVQETASAISQRLGFVPVLLGASGAAGASAARADAT